MSTRLMLSQKSKKYKQEQSLEPEIYPLFRPEIWEVLTPDFREQEFEGTYEQCVQYLRNQCPNGSCEE